MTSDEIAKLIRGSQCEANNGKCKGTLCMRGRMVSCNQCGQPQPNHPVTKHFAGMKAEAPPSIVIPPMDYGHTLTERVLILEKLVTEYGRSITELRGKLAAAEGQKRKVG